MKAQRPSEPTLERHIPRLAALTVLATTIASSQAYDLYREYDPSRPPGILTAPPIRTITALPYLDPDPEPAGTALTFYQVRPLAEPLRAIRVSTRVELWGPPAATGACCVWTGVCEDLDRAACDVVALNYWHGSGTSCGDKPNPCPAGACCDWTDCYDAPNIAVCYSYGEDFVPGASCSDSPSMCGCCMTASGCMNSSRVHCPGTFHPESLCTLFGCM